MRSNIEAPCGFLVFTPALEDLFRRSTAAERRRTVLAASAIGFVILQCYTVLAVIVGADAPNWARLPYFVAITAFVLIATGCFALARTHRLGDALVVAAMILVSVLVCVLYLGDRSPLVNYGLMCYVFVPITSNSMLRLHFRQATTVTTTAVGLFFVVLAIKPGVPAEVAAVAALLVVACSVMTLWANQRADRDERLTFLYLALERLRAEQSRRQAEVLRELTTLDPLTSIANRRGFEERFAVLVETCRTERRPLAVMMIDIDHFKAFNDHYGHIRGDTCLRNVAQTLAGQLRSTDDLIARMGGEEFAIVAPGLSGGAEIVGFLERVRDAVNRLGIPHEGLPDGRRGRVTVSIGCAVARPELPESWANVVQRADRALYQAKNDGRDRWHMAGSTLDAG